MRLRLGSSTHKFNAGHILAFLGVPGWSELSPGQKLQLADHLSALVDELPVKRRVDRPAEFVEDKYRGVD